MKLPLRIVAAIFRRETLALLLAVLLVSAKRANGPQKPEGLDPLEAPIPYNGEFVDVSHSNTLLTRYASKDYAQDLAFYLKRANEASVGRKPGVIHIREVFIKHIDVVLHPNGQTMHFDCSIPPSFITEVPAYEKLYSDSMFSASNGALRIEFVKPLIIDSLVYDHDDERNQTTHWWFDPFQVKDELQPYLKDMTPGSVNYLFFFLDFAKNKETGKEIWPSYGGMAYAGEEMQGARFVTINDHELARGTHEMGHHLYDTTIQETEGMTVTRFHGMTDAGYFGDELWNAETKINGIKLGPIMAYYRDCMRYYYPRDMWERWQMHGKHNIPHEPFSGKPYVWADVKNDYWFKMPQLTIDALKTLTGLKSLKFSAGEAYIVLAVDPNEPLQSARLDGPVASDVALNNCCNLKAESAAVLKTSTGTWVFVKPQMIDLYVDMLKIGGTSQESLPVYGYVLEDEKALIALKLPDGEALPLDEAGFFRPPPAKLQVTGLASPSSNVFRQNVSVTILPDDAHAVVHYTIDDSTPDETSPLYRAPIELDHSAVVRAAFFDGGKRKGADLRAAFEYQPLEVVSEGLKTTVPPLEFRESVTLTMTDSSPGKIHYTLDGFNPTTDSPVYEKPLTIRKDTTVNAQCFGADGKPIGNIWSASYVNHGFEQNLTTDKPVTSSSREEEHVPENAVDGTLREDQGWYSHDAPQWLIVDLQAPHNLDRARVFTYWDGSRYYQYKLETSMDGTNWTMASDMSQNTKISTPEGELLTFPARQARYVKITLLHNSTNPGLHLIQLRVYEVGS